MCPIQYVGEFQTVMNAAEQDKKGHLPHSGGWADQPAILMELVNIYEAATR